MKVLGSCLKKCLSAEVKTDLHWVNFFAGCQRDSQVERLHKQESYYMILYIADQNNKRKYCSAAAICTVVIVSLSCLTFTLSVVRDS
jgi:hypothetical protein